MKIFYLRLFLVIPACSPVYLIQQSEFDQIPKGTKKIVLNVEYGADSLFNSFKKVLLRDGWPIDADKTTMQIKSSGKSIGYGTYMAPLIYVESTSDGSTAYVSGNWSLDVQGQAVLHAVAGVTSTASSEIVFDKSGTSKSDLAFQKLYVICRSAAPSQILYFKP